MDGVVLTTYYTNAPTGSFISETGTLLFIGNSSYVLTPALPFVGKYENVAIYNRILPPAEITAIHNGGTRLPFASYPQAGLKFFFGGMDNTNYAARLNNTLGTLDTVYDLQNGFAGQPINSPTLRAVG